ncbi:MAG: glycosyltransferase family 2 protein [Candidatus Peribacteraceae bacterium]|nr:glycosyltransferase family 2 protein [Candidatus Peribacteraceae bacterium]
MHIVSITRTRNEGDILEVFVRHHCAFVDRMIIVDHRSQDNSREILQKLRGEGLPLDIRHDDGIAHRHGRVMTETARELMAAPDPPDLLMLLDADEFLVRNNGGSPRSVLERSTGILGIPCRNYIPLPSDRKEELNILKRMTHRRPAEDPQWYKICVDGMTLARHPDACIVEGNHKMTSKDGADLPMEKSKELVIAHFPVRTVDQILCKAYGGWFSHLSDPAPVHGGAFQWKALLDTVRQGKRLDAEALTVIALEYATKRQWDRLPSTFTGDLKHLRRTETPDQAPVQDPIPSLIDLRYRHYPADPRTVLLGTAEGLAREHARLLNELRTSGGDRTGHRKTNAR